MLHTYVVLLTLEKSIQLFLLRSSNVPCFFAYFSTSSLRDTLHFVLQLLLGDAPSTERARMTKKSLWIGAVFKFLNIPTETVSKFPISTEGIVRYEFGKRPDKRFERLLHVKGTVFKKENLKTVLLVLLVLFCSAELVVLSVSFSVNVTKKLVRPYFHANWWSLTTINDLGKKRMSMKNHSNTIKRRKPSR